MKVHASRAGYTCRSPGTSHTIRARWVGKVWTSLPAVNYRHQNDLDPVLSWL
jgi:hypothetical protein